MGAANVLAAYHRWAGTVPHRSMAVLAYMAAVSKDSDAHPWFGMGHEALASFALGKKPTRTALRLVGDAVAPLLEVGAISVTRMPAPRSEAGQKTVCYALHLGLSTASDDEEPEEDVRRKPTHERAQKKPHNVRRKNPNRAQKKLATCAEKLRTEEKEEERGAIGGVSGWGPASEPDAREHPDEAPGDPSDDDRPPSDPAQYLEWMRRKKPDSPWLRRVK